MSGNEGVDRLASKEMLRRESEKRAMSKQETPEEKGPLLTISRDYYCGGETFAKKLAAKLGWNLYDKAIVDSIAEDRHADIEAIERVDERVYDCLQVWSNEIFLPGYVGHAAYMKGLVRTTLHIVKEGNAIIVGRGANFLIPEHRRLSVRLTAPLQWRISNYCRMVSSGEDVARKAIEEEDKRRSEFIRRNFRKDLADPLHYDLVVNTKSTDLNTTQTIVIDLLRRRFNLPKSALA